MENNNKITILGDNEEPLFEFEKGTLSYDYWCLLKQSAEFGFAVLPEEKCAQLIVWLLQFGGFFEATTHNMKLNVSIRYAQWKLAAYAGSTRRNPRVIELNNELRASKEYPEWCLAIFERYGLKVPPFPSSFY